MLVLARRAVHVRPPESARIMNTPNLTPGTHPGTLFIGVDVSAAELVVASSPAQPSLRRVYSNSKPGVSALIKAAEHLSQTSEVLVVTEATGNLHVRLQDQLAQAKLPCALVQPFVTAQYARMKGARSKTDAVDAALLAHYGAEQRPEPTTPPSALRRQITQLTATRRGLIEARTRLKNQIGALRRLPEPDSTCVRELTGLLGQLARRIERIEAKRAQVIEQEYAHEMELLTSVKGIGVQTATALVAYAGDLSSFASPRQLVAYIGCDPTHRQSGTSLRVAGGISKRGNRHLRTLLYMGAHTARKYNASCRALYERLVGRGKTKKQALIAVAAKLARQAWAVLHHRREYIDGFGMSPCI